jgi:putative ATP-dependent endonuclease of OLD family
MRITKITIEQFRSISEAMIEVGPFNIFVGQNNHGKTNLFEAIEWFYTGKGDIDKIRFGRAGGDEIVVEIEFADLQDGFEKMRNERNRTSLQNIIGDQERVRIRRGSTDVKNRKIWSELGGGWLEKNPAGFDAALNDFLPKLEYVSTAISPTDFAKYGRNTPIANMLSGVLTEILEQSDTYRAFREKFDELFSSERSEVRVRLDELSGKVQLQLEKQFPDCTRVVFEVTPPAFDDLLKSFDTSIDDGVYTDANEKGDGMQRALMLAILQTYCAFRRERADDASKYFLFFIDEAELHLHPSAQRNLKNALLEIARGGDQVFINTHSSVLVVDDEADQNLFRVEKMERQTRIGPVPPAGKSSVVYELLGGSPADLLLPRNLLIIEGLSEAELLTRVISRFYPDRPQVQVIPAHGDIARARRSFAYLNHAFRTLSHSIFAGRLVIFVDQQDERGPIEAFSAAYPALAPNGQLLESPTRSLEEAYPLPWRRSPQGMAGEAKVNLAREVGDNITQVQFEADMAAVYGALQRTWDLAYD